MNSVNDNSGQHGSARDKDDHKEEHCKKRDNRSSSSSIAHSNRDDVEFKEGLPLHGSNQENESHATIQGTLEVETEDNNSTLIQREVSTVMCSQMHKDPLEIGVPLPILVRMPRLQVAQQQQQQVDQEGTKGTSDNSIPDPAAERREQIDAQVAGALVMREADRAKNIPTVTCLHREVNMTQDSVPGAYNVDGCVSSEWNRDISTVTYEREILASRFDIECLAEATLVEDASVHEGSDERTSKDKTGLENDHDDDRNNTSSTSNLSDSLSQDRPTTPLPRGGRHHDNAALSTDEEHGMSVDLDGDTLIFEATPLQSKCILNRRAVVIGAIVTSIVVLALAVTIPLMSSGEDPESLLFPDDSEVLAYVPETICFSLLPLMTNVSKSCPDPASLPHGGPVSQVIVDGLLKASDPTANIDIAIINGGATRGDILHGPLTVGDVRSTILPFVSNRVVYVSVTPKELKASLEGSMYDKGFLASEAQQLTFFPGVPTVKLNWAYESAYPYAAGLRFGVDLTAPEGDKFNNIEFINGREGWTPLDITDDKTMLRVLTSDFIADGGDGYFPGLSQERRKIQSELGVTDLFLLFCAEQKEILGPVIPDGMSTQSFTPLKDNSR